MAEPKLNELMEKIVSLCKRRGFIFQSSEIYGGINGFWDYGPLGAELKRNVRELWWRAHTQRREDVVGLDATIIMHPSIWKASGHVDTFSDPMCDCLLTKRRFRADQVEPLSGIAYWYSGAESDGQLTARDRSELEAWLAQLGDVVEPNDVKLRVQERIRLVQSLFDFSSLEGIRAASVSLSSLGQETKCIQDLLNEFLEKFSRTSEQEFAVLLPPGKPPESALRTATEFYSKLGVRNPAPILERTEPVENSRRFNSEKGEGFGALLTEPRAFNLMFKTYVGPVESEENVAYLRPETAQAIFAQFKNVLDVSRQKVPFGICQIGKAFRNEINPRNFTFRSREFEQMEIEFFIRPDEVVQKVAGSVGAYTDGVDVSTPQPNWGWELWHRHWVEERVKWYESIGLGRDTLDFHWQPKEELAHYAKACVDIQYKFPFGTQELEGIAARGDFDLSQHQKFSGKSMEYFDEEAKMKYVPHVIEPSAGVDRLILALICEAYCEDQAPNDKGELESRVVMKFHPRIAPIKAGVFPLLKNKPDLVAKAREVRDLLRPYLTVFYDEAGAIGRRYRRQDEAGTPFCVTIDFDTLGEKGPELKDTVTIRDRDTLKQERIAIKDLPQRIAEAVR